MRPLPLPPLPQQLLLLQSESNEQEEDASVPPSPQIERIMQGEGTNEEGAAPVPPFSQIEWPPIAVLGAILGEAGLWRGEN